VAERRAQNAERLQEAEKNRVFGRPASAFRIERLRQEGFETEEIERIRQNLTTYAEALRAESEDGSLKPTYKLDIEERAENRMIREELLSDREFDAALFATNQMNRVEITRIAEGTRTGEAGLRAGDQVLSVNGIRVFDRPDFRDARALRQEGELHRIVILRGDDFFDVDVLCCDAGWSGIGVILAPPLSDSVER
jgi:predicted metalloprotease with PDZ domain